MLPRLGFVSERVLQAGCVVKQSTLSAAVRGSKHPVIWHACAVLCQHVLSCYAVLTCAIMLCCVGTGLACGCSGWRWQLQDLVAQHKMTPDYVGDLHLPQQLQQHALHTQQPHPSSQQQQQQQRMPRQSDPDMQRSWQQEVSMFCMHQVWAHTSRWVMKYCVCPQSLNVCPCSSITHVVTCACTLQDMSCSCHLLIHKPSCGLHPPPPPCMLPDAYMSKHGNVTRSPPPPNLGPPRYTFQKSPHQPCDNSQPLMSPLLLLCSTTWSSKSWGPSRRCWCVS